MKLVVGTCCDCQENVTCHEIPNPDGEDCTILVSGAVAVNPVDYACDKHLFYGSTCSGSGMCPQAAWVESP